MFRLACAIILILFLSSCAGLLADEMERRGVQACTFWRNPITGGRSVRATGGVPIDVCLKIPCMLYP